MPDRMPDPEQDMRRHWMGVLARADAQAIEARLAEAPALPPHDLLRAPETGLVMVRGRAGGDGAPFNLGEMTVTRCAVRDAAGRMGLGYVAGRDRRHAELAAILDAALQDGARHAALMQTVIEPLAAAQAADAARDARRAAATRVEFFTMQTMRGGS